MKDIVDPDKATSFVESVPDSAFQKVESGIYVAIAQGPGGLILIRKKYGRRMAIEMSVISQLIDHLAASMLPDQTRH